MFRSLLRADNGMDRSPWGSFWFEPVSSLTGSGQRITPDSALAQAAVYACVRVLSESFAVLPFRLYRPLAGGGRQQIVDHWLYRLFRRRPNRYQTPFAWREMMESHIAMRGNCFNQIIEDGTGGIAELLPMHPDRMRVELVSEYGYRYLYTQRDGTQIRLRPDQVWHIRGLSADGFVGMNPIEINRESIGEALQYQTYASRFFANSARPPMWIKFPGKFADATAKQTFREQLQSGQTGMNRGKTIVLDQGMELMALDVNHSDLQFIEARGLKTAEIARIFRVPPHKIGDLSKATFSNIEQQAIEFWQDTMHPICERWESSIMADLLGADSELEVEFDMRQQMRGDAASRAMYIHSGVLDGWLTRNEGRAMEGLDPIDGLDEPLVPINEQTLEESQRPPQPVQPPAVGEPAKEPPPENGNTEDGGTEDKGARFARMLRGNAARMARRIEAGQMPSADLLADALAVSEADAQAWIDAYAPSPLSETLAQLERLAKL